MNARVLRHGLPDGGSVDEGHGDVREGDRVPARDRLALGRHPGPLAQGAAEAGGVTWWGNNK